VSRGEICARCEHFTFTGRPEQAAEGSGRCTGYGDSPVEPFVAWDKRFCVLFGPAPDMKPRERWIKAQQNKTEAREED
jgi:hypothetical protein